MQRSNTGAIKRVITKRLVISRRQVLENLSLNDSPDINDLPDDCLIHIFSFLPILERLEAEKVCKRWYTISKEGWDDVKALRITSKYTNDTLYQTLKRCGRFLRELDWHCSPRHPQCSQMILQFCRLDQLKDICIWCYDRTINVEDFTRDLRLIFQRARNLVTVHIHTEYMLNSIDFLNVLNRETLETLIFNDQSSRSESNRQLSINPDDFPNLKELELRNIIITEGEMGRDEGSLKGLVKLKLYMCDFPEAFEARIKTFENLQELTLEGSEFVHGNEQIRDIARYCNKIRKMELISCSNATSDCFQYLGRMPLLEILRYDDIEYMSRDNLISLSNVRELSFGIFEGDFNEDGLVELIAQSSNLERLTLWYESEVESRTLVDEIRQFFHAGLGRRPLRLILELCDLKGDKTLEVSDHPLLTILHNPAGMWIDD